MKRTTYTWAITDHVCSACFGRIVECKPDGGPRVCRCTNCGAEGERTRGMAHPPICACGMSIGKRNIGLRCVVNPQPTPECPSEVIAKEIVWTPAASIESQGPARKRTPMRAADMDSETLWPWL